jgi:hypothetical protein
MKNKYVVTVAVMLFSFSTAIFGQAEGENAGGWERTAVGTLTFTQTSFDNWQAGGEDSWSWLLNVDASMNKVQENSSWTNNLKLNYGQTSVGGADARKAADELKFESVYTWMRGWFVDPYVAFTARTQLTDGYQYNDTSKVKVSALLDPGYFTQSFGVGYQPNDILKTRLGIAAKETMGSEDFVDVGYAYADDPDTEDEVETLKTEFGMESVTDVKMKLSENILFTSKLEAFSNFESFEEIDVNWDNLFAAKVSELINVSLNIKVYYDHDISSIRQLQQTLGIGVSYTFF